MENQSLQNVADQINKQSSQNQARRPGRPSKNQSQAIKPELIQPSQINQQQFNNNFTENKDYSAYFEKLFKLFDEFLIKIYKDEGLRTSPTDLSLMSQSSSDFLNDFFPNVQSKFLKLGLFVIILLGVFYEKIILINKKAAEDKKKEPKNEQNVKKEENNQPGAILLGPSQFIK